MWISHRSRYITFQSKSNDRTAKSIYSPQGKLFKKQPRATKEQGEKKAKAKAKAKGLYFFVIR